MPPTPMRLSRPLRLRSTRQRKRAIVSSMLTSNALREMFFQATATAGKQIGGKGRIMKTTSPERLVPEGLFLLHTIAGNRSVHFCDPWLSRYIFPNSMLPSSRQISSAAEKLLVLEDWHSFGPHYDLLHCLAWFHNFRASWDHIRHAYDGRFFRMWIYYLLACAGSFRARRNQLWQIVFSNNGVRNGYENVR